MLTKNEAILSIINKPILNGDKWQILSKKFTYENGRLLSKHEIISYINALSSEQRANVYLNNPKLKSLLSVKRVRSMSGIVPITIFTKPYFCSGNCVFCPTDNTLPKSYLSDEPAVQRAIGQNYDPYFQIIRRLESLRNNNHSTDKVEIIISGGTWDDYSFEYRVDFIKKIFIALNHLDLNKYATYSLDELQSINETALSRCVGMSIETRPNKISIDSIKEYRKFGVTKVQLGVQSMNDQILLANNRMHTAQDTFEAINLLRINGFKIMVHWMCNLYQATIEKDYEDFKSLFDKNTGIYPDEMKIYPCVLVEKTALYELYKKNKYKPYSTSDLIELLVKCKRIVPPYTRISRLFRDIPTNNIIAGTTLTNLREYVLKKMHQDGFKCNCIRCNEIKEEKPSIRELTLNTVEYNTNNTIEFFLSFRTKHDKIAGFLRLSILNNTKQANKTILNSMNAELIEDFDCCIRELHVYGPSEPISITQNSDSQYTQHRGIGTQLLKEAEKIALSYNCKKLGVISAVGTRQYYMKRGFEFTGEYGYGIKALILAS
ncbi:MAG TPA: tRNA uridine(34) 5-carboxymethylaminomethyl modification radical SAM/GNAT enzyme Elp3 [Candidatus Dojkabacteria bacterium]|nr:tRNA uridine(34) 5-carboxymethylaminomethyl modification radical SAM/GNAT enzyme Elp3 [Candidatus Dojkabacteria bacterium]